jgi:hypothetical protein
MASPDELMRSVRNFEAMLDRMHWTGASQVAELKSLEILVGKYPKQARELLTRHDQPSRRNGSTDGRPPCEEASFEQANTSSSAR